MAATRAAPTLVHIQESPRDLLKHRLFQEVRGGACDSGFVISPMPPPPHPPVLMLLAHGRHIGVWTLDKVVQESLLTDEFVDAVSQMRKPRKRGSWRLVPVHIWEVSTLTHFPGNPTERGWQ